MFYSLFRQGTTSTPALSEFWSEWVLFLCWNSGKRTNTPEAVDEVKKLWSILKYYFLGLLFSFSSTSLFFIWRFTTLWRWLLCCKITALCVVDVALHQGLLLLQQNTAVSHCFSFSDTGQPHSVFISAKLCSSAKLTPGQVAEDSEWNIILNFYLEFAPLWTCLEQYITTHHAWSELKPKIRECLSLSGCSCFIFYAVVLGAHGCSYFFLFRIIKKQKKAVMKKKKTL